MANRRAIVTQSELTRCLKAHRDAGIPIAKTETKPDGTIVVYAVSQADQTKDNPWDHP
jgi:hypothetical protein